MRRLFIDYYKPHRKLFFADLFFAFLLAVCDLFYPMIAKNIILSFLLFGRVVNGVVPIEAQPFNREPVAHHARNRGRSSIILPLISCRRLMPSSRRIFSKNGISI